MSGSPSSPGRALSRRDLLRLAGSGAVAIGLAACTSRDGSSADPTDQGSTTASGPFTSPPEVRSDGGTLQVTLTAAAAMVPYGDRSRYALTYNGSTPGPTLRARPGDSLTVTLENRLDEPTNLHVHGLHVSPEGDSDNVFVMIAPGESRTYRYQIPADHPSGTFWYHPHHHGTVAGQVAGGLAGLIVIEDDIDDALAATTERLLVLSDPPVGDDASSLMVAPAEQMTGREGDVVLVNGLERPQLTTTAGTVERWRILNASASRYYRLAVDGHTMELLGSDQGRLDAPLPIGDLVLTPGQRAEVAVRFDQPGSSTLRTATDVRTTMGPGGGMGGVGGMGGMGGMGGGAGRTSDDASIELLEVTVTGSAEVPSPALPDQLRPAPATGAVDGTRTITLGAMGMGASAFVIDGRGFDPARTDLTATLGTTEEWTVVNASMMDHPFHLHVWPFEVVERSDGPADPGWRDTVDVPVGATVRIRVVFADYAGRAVYHCHILDHEDLGMMGVIDVR